MAVGYQGLIDEVGGFTIGHSVPGKLATFQHADQPPTIILPSIAGPLEIQDTSRTHNFASTCFPYYPHHPPPSSPPLLFLHLPPHLPSPPTPPSSPPTSPLPGLPLVVGDVEKPRAGSLTLNKNRVETLGLFPFWGNISSAARARIGR